MRLHTGAVYIEEKAVYMNDIHGKMGNTEILQYYKYMYTLRLNYNAGVVGVHGGKTHYNEPHYIHATVIQNL